SPSVAGRIDSEAGEEVVGGEVLEWIETRADRTNVGVGTIERGDRLPQSQVARGPRARAGQVARKEPVRRPLAEAALGDEPRLHVVVRQQRERVEIEIAA